MDSITVQNWKRSITYHPHSVETITSVEDIQRIVNDKARYPTPVRAKGSHHSTTRCVVAEGGTVLDMTQLNKILNIDKKRCEITMQAGVLYIDAAKKLERSGLQFYVNVEIGNLTVGSGACGGTKDASYFSLAQGWEYGQVASYCIGVKTVQADGTLLEVTEENDHELMAAMRSSYGMLGVLYEVTYRVKPIVPLAVEHQAYDVGDFADNLETLIAGERSMMLYLLPFLDKVVVEYRSDGLGEVRPGAWQWHVRNFVWKAVGPGYSMILGYIVPIRPLRYVLINLFNRVVVWFLTTILKVSDSSPADQIIHYAPTAGFASYTFSIWAFPREHFPQALRDYFAFCKQYRIDNNYRSDLLNVGYHIIEDRQSLFSYTRRGPALTLDPVATGLPGWEGFLIAYNQFCSERNGTPLFNQTGSLTGHQAQKAFGEEIAIFQSYRRKMDPTDRFYTDYFRRMFENQ